jgi:hypothetical protein
MNRLFKITTLATFIVFSISACKESKEQPSNEISKVYKRVMSDFKETDRIANKNGSFQLIGIEDGRKALIKVAKNGDIKEYYLFYQLDELDSKLKESIRTRREFSLNDFRESNPHLLPFKFHSLFYRHRLIKNRRSHGGDSYTFSIDEQIDVVYRMHDREQRDIDLVFSPRGELEYQEQDLD